MTWCAVWKGSGRACLEHLGEKHGGSTLEVTTNVARFFLPWTVTRDVWLTALHPEVSGVAVDALLFHEAGRRLVHTYCVYKDLFPHPALRGDVVPRLLSCVIRAMAIARLTHLRISIPSTGAPPGQVPPECFPGSTAPVQLSRRRKVMHELCLLGVSHKTKTTPYHPESDGLVERFNRTLLMMLAMFAGEHKDDWDDLLPPVMMAYRLSVHESTGFSPYRLMFGEECMLPMDIGLPRRQPDLAEDVLSPYAVWVKDSLEVAFDQVCRHSSQAVMRQKRLYDQRAVRRLLKIGSCKLDSIWTGPYLIVVTLGWTVGIQRHPDEPVIFIHCQDVKKIP